MATTGNEYKFRLTRNDIGDTSFVVQPLTLDGTTTPSPVLNENAILVTPDPIGSTANTSLTLLGKGTPGYGDIVQQNFIYLLENFAHSNQPTTPIEGQLWYDTAVPQIKVYNGSAFVDPSADKVLKAGDTMTGNLVINNGGAQSITLRTDGTVRVSTGPVDSLDLATKQYVDTIQTTGVTDYVNVTGDTMTGVLNMNAADITLSGGARVTDPVLPTADNQLSNKKYVDDRFNTIVASGGTQFVDRAELQSNGDLELFYTGNASATADVIVDASAAGGGVGGKTAAFINVDTFEDATGTPIAGQTVQSIIETFAIRKLDSDNPAIADKEYVRKQIVDAFGGIQRTIYTVGTGEGATGFSTTIDPFTVGQNQVWVYDNAGTKMRLTSAGFQDLGMNEVLPSTSVYPTHLFTSVSDGVAYHFNIDVDVGGPGITDVTVTPSYEGPENPSTETMIIASTDHTTETVNFPGDQRTKFVPNLTFDIAGSEGNTNDGTFTVTSVEFNTLTDETEVTVAENLNAITTTHGDALVPLPDRYSIVKLVEDINTGLTAASVGPGDTPGATVVFDEGTQNIRFVSNTVGNNSTITLADDNIANNGNPLFAALPEFLNLTTYDVKFYQPEGDEATYNKHAYIALDGNHLLTFNNPLSIVVRESGDEITTNDGEYETIDVGAGVYALYEVVGDYTKVYVQLLTADEDVRLLSTTTTGAEGFVGLPAAVVPTTAKNGFTGTYSETGTYNQSSTTIAVAGAATTDTDVLEIMVF